MPILKLFCNSFNTIKVDIDVTTFNFYGSTEDYNYDDEQSFNSVGFTLSDISKTNEVFEEIKSLFKLNPEYCKVEDYVKLRTEFESYRKDKRPRISIKFKSGHKGSTNPPEFSFE